MTIAYKTATGSPVWIARYDGPAGNNDYSYSLGISPDGARIYVGGYGENAALGLDYATIAYDAATGTQLWATRYDGPQRSSDYANYLAVSADGLRVFVAGSSQGHFGLDYATVGYDAATGTQLWATRFHAPGNKNDEPKGLAVSPDGARVYVTGQSYVGVTRYDAVTVAYDAATGAAIWTVRAGQARADSGMGVEVSPNGVALYVTGDYSSLLSHTEDYGTIAYMTGVSFPV